MSLPRRGVLRLAAGAAALPMLSGRAWPQAYPTRPVRLVEGFGAGGSPDIIARLIGQRLQERLGQPFIIENRSGAATNIATEAVARAAPDGHTLLIIVSTNAINATFYDKLNFNFLRDIAPVAGISRGPLVMEVHPSVPAKTVAEFIAYAKANPGKINMGTAGIGSVTHIAGELLQMLTGIRMLHVPYRGAQVLTGLISGQVDIYFGPLPASREHINTGRVRALAVTTDTRWPALPDIPTIGETVPGYEASVWFGVGAPAGTPPEIIEKLNQEINAAIADPKIKGQLFDLGGTLLAGPPAEFGQFLVVEVEKWAKVIRAGNLKPE
jgi:tripartite-type tricarboxylate transporter receptor subunit TctC